MMDADVRKLKVSNKEVNLAQLIRVWGVIVHVRPIPIQVYEQLQETS
jgi:hypothetical protein